MKNSRRTLPKQLLSKLGGLGSKLFLSLIIANLLVFPTISTAFVQAATPAQRVSFTADPTWKTIIIDHYAPYTFVNADGQPAGFSVDLMRAVAQVMGINLEVKVDTWDNAIHALENGEIDFLPMMAYSAERDKLYDFSPPHTIAFDAFFTRKDASPIRSMDDLSGKTIIVMESDQAHDYLRSLASIRAEQLILVDSLPEALRLLASGRGDTALMPKLVGLALIRDLNLTNLGPSPVVVESYNRPFSFAVKDGNQAILERLNQGMSIVKATGQYDEIYKKWFGTLEPGGATNELFLKVLGGTILAFLLIGVVLLLWSFSLRKQVAARTKSLEMEIQERKQTEESLKESEALLRAVAENYPNSYISIIEKDLTVGFTSGQEFKKQKLDPSQFVGLTLEQVFGEQAPLVRDHYLTTFNGAETQFELLINNQYQYYRTVPLLDQNGNITRILTVVENITERKQAEESLRQSEERFRSYFNLPLAGRAITSVNAGWIDVNAALCDMLGYTKAEFMEKTWPELTHPADLPADLAQFNRVMAGEIDGYTLEKRFVHKDGHSIDTNLVVHCVRHPDRSVDYFVALIQDITERKQAEQTIIKSEQRFHRTMNNMEEGVLLLGYDWTYLFINKAAEIQGGRPVDELLGRTVMECWPGIETTDFFKLEQKVMQDRLPAQIEGTYTLGDGQEHWFSWHIQPADEGLLIITMDITARKQVEGEIRSLNAELEQRVTQRTALLEASNKELEAFAYSVSHDLRAPLRAMEGFSSALLSHHKEQLDEQGQHYLERIQQASQRMGQLINDLLNLSRITRTDFNRQRVDLSQFAREIAAELQTRDPQRQVDFAVTEALMVQGDAHLLRIALQNLLENAWKFSSTRQQAAIEVGSMTIADFMLQNEDWASHLSPPEIQNPNSNIYFVCDNGVGFDMAFTAKLFAPFQRLHAMHEFPGTGIGLAIVQRILTRHGGRIWSSAQVEQGATFYFTLGGNS